MKEKSARVLVTLMCNRKCVGCCNNNLVCQYTEIESAVELLKYDNIVITGGEPTLIRLEVYELVANLRALGYENPIYMYHASYSHEDYHLLRVLNGITYTLHDNCKDSDIIMLGELTKDLTRLKNLGIDFSARLIIDKRVYEDYDLSNIDLRNWDVIRKLQWKDECPTAPNEDLLYLPLKGR